REPCDRAGALLMFDEVITGFRLGVGGATERFGVTPDLWAFGKVIGGGLPVGAFGASRELMAHLAPLGPVSPAGPLPGNPLATAAGLAALSQLDAEAYRRLAATAERLAQGLHRAFTDAGVPVQVPRVGPLVGLFFGAEPVNNFPSAQRSAESGRYRSFFRAML